MTINWVALLQVAGVTIGIAVLAVCMVAFAAKLLDDGHHLVKDGESPGVRIVAGYILFGLVALIVLFGLWLIIPYFHH